MKRTDKYPPPTPEDVARVAANRSTHKVHPLLWVVLAIAVVIGVGLYSDLVGFYEFEDVEEMISGDEHDDEGDRKKNDSEKSDSEKSDGHGKSED